MTRALPALFVVLTAGAITIATVSAQDTPTVPTETALRWEIAALKQQLALAQAEQQVCAGQLAPTAYQEAMAAIEQDVETVRAAFEADHPGWTLNPQGQPVHTEEASASAEGDP